jgi:hypothetical protein
MKGRKIAIVGSGSNRIAAEEIRIAFDEYRDGTFIKRR